MGKTSWIALAALLLAPAPALAQQKSQQPSSGESAQAESSSQTSQSAASAQEDPLVMAARKAREQRKNAPKAVKVFTNDNLPTQGGISSVGQEVAAPAPEKKGEKEAAGAKAAPSGNDAAAWRAKFAKLREKLQRDQNELSIMQRELGVDALQYYGGNPQKAAADQDSGQPFGEDYNKKRAAIDAKQKQVDADQQAISDAEDALRQAGGDPGWAR